MNEDVLKEEFIKYFGEDKWNQEEMIEKALSYQIEVCRFLNIDIPPMIVDDIEEDSRYYIKEDYIAISKETIKSFIETIKALIHECRHKFQYCCCYKGLDYNEKLKEEWLKDFNTIKELNVNNQESIDRYYISIIELDAFAFTKWYLKEKLNYIIHHPVHEYDQILDLYIKKYFK